MRTFRKLLLNALLGGVTGTFLWFAVTFWAYLETGSVVVTSVIGGAFGLASALFGMAFGTYVDHHRKHRAMLLATSITTVCYSAATALYVAVDSDNLVQLRNVWLWLLIALIMVGSVAGNLRGIAMSTCVTLLVPEDLRDRANGLAGMVTGIAMAITSVFSGVVVGQLGMGWAIGFGMGLSAISLLHLLSIRFDEPVPVATDQHGQRNKRIDVRGALSTVKSIQGLGPLIAFAAFNNVLFGIYMSLLDAYGLELMSVEAWGLMWGLLSLCLVVGGLLVARFGLGRRPMRVLITANVAVWIVASVFSVRTSVAATGIGLAIWMASFPVIEAAEQTVMQRVVPFDFQGRVFGFAQTVESSVSPLVALAIGPFAEQVTIPFMTTGRGGRWAVDWFGNGIQRGIALCFTVAGLIGFVIALFARRSRSYRALDALSLWSS